MLDPWLPVAGRLDSAPPESRWSASGSGRWQVARSRAEGVAGGGQGLEQGVQRLVTQWAQGGGDELLDGRQHLVEEVLGGGGSRVSRTLVMVAVLMCI
jgi:hypothetical protein